MKIRSFFRSSRLRKDESGSFTLEGALAVPIALILVAAVSFSFLASAQTALSYVAANESSDRISQHWNNSYKHPVTGMFSTLQHDPLFWRWRQEGASLFGGDGETSALASLPASSESSGTLTSRKLGRGAAGWPTAYFGTSRFENDGWFRSVTVDASVPLSLPNGLGFPDAAAGRSTKTISEPSEFIRNVELILGYLPALKGTTEGDKIRNLVSPWADKPDLVPDVDRTLTFRDHANAVGYLRTLVRGQQSREKTEDTGKWRLIDARDKQGVAHQAYIGAKLPNKDVRDQLMKDAELIRRGKVKGVVWHFFRRTGEAASGPSPTLKQLLQENGIVYVIHS